MKFRYVQRAEWPYQPFDLQAVWKSKDFLVQVYSDRNYTRLSVSRTSWKEINGKTQWDDNITWDELQEIKSSIPGFNDKWMVEIYPPQDEIVNVANMRHLWLIDTPSYGWNTKRQHNEISTP